MKLTTNIQSYKRAGAVSTLKLFPDAALWVHAFEADAYRGAYPKADVRVLPDDTRGNPPRVKNFILDAVLNGEGADACLFLDDDITKVCHFFNKTLIPLQGERLRWFVLKHTVLCQEWGFKLWGLNVTFDKQVYREYTPFSTLSYVSSSFACFLRGNTLRYDERFPPKEDYDMTLPQCQKYRGLLRVNKGSYVKKSAENVGGCAGYRNVDRERQQVQALQAKWGSSVVRLDSLETSRNHRTTKRRTFDIKPVIEVPIQGL